MWHHTSGNWGLDLSRSQIINRESDILFSIINNQRRRNVIRCLYEVDEAIELRDLVEYLAELEKASKKNSIYASLIQTHLPLMNRNNIVNYDKRRNTVQLTEFGKKCDYYLEIISQDEIPWHMYYLTLSTFSLLLIPLVENYAYAVIVISFFISSLFHAREMRKRKIKAQK